ncbi:MAG: hypothetical protein QW812_04270 [Thermoplasmataceae archaeon]
MNENPATHQGVGAFKLYSERFPLKYLFSERGICIGVDTKKCSYLFLVCRYGILLRRRNVGDKVVENLGYEIELIYRAVKNETLKR